MRVGYVRVSTVGQNTARQEVLMEELDTEWMFIDRTSGKNTSRPALRQMMDFVREGDMVVVESIENFCRDVRTGFHDVFMCLKEATVVTNWWINVSEKYVNMLERTLVWNVLNHMFGSNYQRVIKNMRNCRSILTTNYPYAPRLASASSADINLLNKKKGKLHNLVQLRVLMVHFH